jgi:hypothetical protein
MRKDIAPKINIMKVWEIHMIHPKALPETMPMPNISSDLLTAAG